MSLTNITKIENQYTKPLFYSLLAIVILVFSAYLYFRYHLVYVHRLDLGGLENNVIYGIQKILAGFPLYINPESPPFDLIQKSPAYYYLLAGLCRLFNISMEQPIEIFRLSRIVSLILNLISIGVFGVMSYQCFKIKRVATLIMSMVMMMIYTQHYYSRLDALYGFFFVLSLYCFFKYWSHFQKKYLLATALCCVFLVFSKQTGAVLVLGMGLSLLWTSDRWFNLLIFASTGIIATLVLILLWDIYPYFYYQNAILGVRNGWSFDFLNGVLTSQYQLSLIVVCLWSLYLFYETRAGDNLSNLLFSFTLFYLLFGLVSCLKIAAGLNYLIEYKILLLLILGTLAFQRHHQMPYATIARLLFYFVVLNIVASKIHHTYNQYQFGNYKDNIEQYEKAQAISTYFKQELNLTPNEYIYFEENSFITHFLPSNMLLSVKSTTTEVYNSNTQTLNYKALFEGMNKGLIQYLLIKKEKVPQVSFCLGQPFDRGAFEKIATVNDMNVYKYKE